MARKKMGKTIDSGSYPMSTARKRTPRMPHSSGDKLPAYMKKRGGSKKRGY